MTDASKRDVALIDSFSDVRSVVADPLRFKMRLGIGEDAYASLRAKKHLANFVDIGGWGATGAGVAASKTVATTFFAPTGLMAMLGLGTAVTPVGWVVGAAVTSAGAYYGVTRLFGRYNGSRVDTIPRFINTPIDVLGAALFDLMGGLAVRVANIDGHIDERELKAISDHFVRDWGLDNEYVTSAMHVLQANISRATIKDMARELAKFQVENPDCNDAEMQLVLVEFLREVALADGAIDEREELAIDAIAAAMRNATPGLTTRAKNAALDLGQVAGDTAASMGRKISVLNIGRLVPRFLRRR